VIPLHLQTLYREHRSIAAVLSTLEHLADGIESRGERVEPRLFQAILHYLDIFPERHHHPKEESCLFDAIRARTHEADEVLAELQRQHEHGGTAIKSLERALQSWQSGGPAEQAAFVAAAKRYVQRYFKHMRLEEDGVMPIAAKVLSKEDWISIERAFAEHHDPIEATDDPKALLHQILMLAPPPIGIGPAAR
jgi:hemerythrin-like domain-containing protein